MANDIDSFFGRVLEAHRDAPAALVMTPIVNPSFAVFRCREDAPFFARVASVLNSEPQNAKRKNLPTVMVQRNLASAMRSFLDTQRQAPVARRAVVTASLSLFRHSCAVGVPSKLSAMAVHAVICALHAATVPAPAGGTTSHHQRAQASPAAAAVAGGGARGRPTLGTDGFPESQLAAFLMDATRLEPPPPPMTPLSVPSDVAVKIVSTFGIGKCNSKDVLEWGGPQVSGSLRGSVRRIARRLQVEGNWTLISGLVKHMETPRGIDECERVLGMTLAELIAAAMLGEEWEQARRLVSSAAAGPPRQTLARALIPAALDASALEIATQLIEDNNLVPEFPEYNALVRKIWLEKKKEKLEAFIVRPGWKMAQHVLEDRYPHERELRVWLVEHMLKLGNLPAAAELMDRFDLHGTMPPLDPALVEAAARKRAAAHLQLAISDSRIVVVDGFQALQYAQRALMKPAPVGGRAGGPAGVVCVGLDVENCPTTTKAKLLQVATCTDVFLFDLVALTARKAHPELSRHFDATMEALLSDPHIVKLGFAFGPDMAALRKACQSMRGKHGRRACLRVGDLSSAVLGRETPSLSKTCEAWLGKPLDKTECVSKWGKRPLTVDQVKYAALDAHCLVGIFEEMLLEGGGRLASATTEGRGGGDPHAWWYERLVTNVDGSGRNR
ncbi:unnamed protein product [Scytosiphon promiscuus]